MALFGIPGLSFSINRLIGITAFKRRVAQNTGIPTSKAGVEKKIGSIILRTLFSKK